LPTQRGQSGPITIGYAGKLSERLDIDLIRRTVRRLAPARFVFAGPTITRSVRRALDDIDGVQLLGDVPYGDYPRLLTSWDLGWVPHRLSEGEIGGDVLKIYEFRAAGLPTFITPIIGSDRALQGVRVGRPGDLADMIESFVGGRLRIPRELIQLDEHHRWESKARHQMRLLGIPTAGES
jgi:glycosyltransferase involved in cell wall biosynthesis